MYKRYIIAVLLILAFIVSACAPQAAPAPVNQGQPAEKPAAEQPAEKPAAEKPAEEKPAEAPAPEVSAYKESPMLTELVNAGKLPPIEDRLPQEPFIVGPGTLIVEKDLPDWQPGKFGGTLRFAHSVANWNPDIFIMMNENLLCAPGIGLEGLQGCVIKDYTVENNNTVFTLTLRKGLKWSDGQPVTTEDVRFVYEDVYLNETLTPRFPPMFKDSGSPEGEQMKLEIVDDFTFRLIFSKPYGGLLRELSIKGWQGYTILLRPSHYLKQYHLNYVTMEDLKPELDRLNLTEEWWQVYHEKDCVNWENTNPLCANYPMLNPWVGVKTVDGMLAFERNPYYWKVDTAGQQLPYIDKLSSQQVNDVEMLTLKVLNGEVDFVRESTALVKLPLYKENEQKAGFRTLLMDNHVDPTCLFINNTFDDANWRAVVNDLRFRQAVNYAINRQEIIDNIYYGLASLPELVPSEFNQEKANQLLDEMGLDKRDGDGYRIGPDGKTFDFPIEHGAHAPDISPAIEILVSQLRAVGINATSKQVDPSLWGSRAGANELQATVLWNVQPMWKDATWTDYLPGQAGWSPMWSLWYSSNGANGEEPPAEIQQMYKYHEARIAAVPNSADDTQLRDSIYKIMYDNIYIFPLAEKVNYAMIVSSKLGNVPSAGQAIGADYSGEQFFFK
jgi:peptide/nickel transport system substrate-binding protein